MRYPEKQRHEFIRETLEDKGYINSKDIIQKFGVGTATASRDLTRFKKLNDDFVEYNLSNRRYEKV